MNRARHCPKRWRDKSPRKGRSVCAGEEDEDYNASRFSASAASSCIVFVTRYSRPSIQTFASTISWPAEAGTL